MVGMTERPKLEASGRPSQENTVSVDLKNELFLIFSKTGCIEIKLSMICKNI